MDLVPLVDWVAPGVAAVLKSSDPGVAGFAVADVSPGAIVTDPTDGLELHPARRILKTAKRERKERFLAIWKDYHAEQNNSLGREAKCHDAALAYDRSLCLPCGLRQQYGRWQRNPV